jgi:hypothetical protein
MPRALEVLDATLRRIEQGEIDGIEALDQRDAPRFIVRTFLKAQPALRLKSIQGGNVSRSMLTTDRIRVCNA